MSTFSNNSDDLNDNLNDIPTQQNTNNLESNSANDYNPFNIPSLELKSPNEFNGAIALMGCPPPFKGNKSNFANLPIEMQAAYADGVIRGNYEKKWLIDSFNSSSSNDLLHANDVAIGALAYFYLKTQNQSAFDQVQSWNAQNKNNNSNF